MCRRRRRSSRRQLGEDRSGPLPVQLRLEAASIPSGSEAQRRLVPRLVSARRVRRRRRRSSAACRRRGSGARARRLVEPERAGEQREAVRARRLDAARDRRSRYPEIAGPQGTRSTDRAVAAGRRRRLDDAADAGLCASTLLTRGSRTSRSRCRAAGASEPGRMPRPSRRSPPVRRPPAICRRWRAPEVLPAPARGTYAVGCRC